MSVLPGCTGPIGPDDPVETRRSAERELALIAKTACDTPEAHTGGIAPLIVDYGSATFAHVLFEASGMAVSCVLYPEGSTWVPAHIVTAGRGQTDAPILWDRWCEEAWISVVIQMPTQSNRVLFEASGGRTTASIADKLAVGSFPASLGGEKHPLRVTTSDRSDLLTVSCGPLG